MREWYMNNAQQCTLSGKSWNACKKKKKKKENARFWNIKHWIQTHMKTVTINHHFCCEIFRRSNRQTRVRFWKPHSLTTVQGVHCKNGISSFVSLKDQSVHWFLINPVRLYGPVQIYHATLTWLEIETY